MDTQTRNYITLPDAPAIPGLTFRRFAGGEDWQSLLRLNTESKLVDGMEHDLHTLDSLQLVYGPTAKSDPLNDILIAEVDGTPVAFNRVMWNRELEGALVYVHVGFVSPEWRGKGIGRALIHYAEGRLREIAATHQGDGERWLEADHLSTQPHLETLLMSEGYVPVRHFYDMVNLDLVNIKDAPMPEGLEVRPATPDQYRAIWDAGVEAFRDHWGEHEEDESSYERWQKHPTFQPHLWQVAWDGDQVAGMVQNFVNEEYNTEFSKKRGYTENISVRRPWRKRGLASALITRSQRMFRDMGMTEVALGVDTENPSGALKLYESLGYRQVRVAVLSRKPL